MTAGTASGVVGIAAEAVVKAARAAGVHEMVLAMPDGYSTPIGEQGCRLSGGQRQRIALARALYGDPRLLVLDEPNANLDTEGENALVAAITAAAARGTTVMFVSHRPSLVGCADTLMMLRSGAMEMYGPRDEVLAKITVPLRPATVAEHPAEARYG